MNFQSKELTEREKVITELKNSLSITLEKYNKLKIDFEKQKQYYIQLTINLRNQKKKSSTSTPRPKISPKEYKISHFYFMFIKSPDKKQIKSKSEKNVLKNEIKKLKEEFEKYKNESMNKEGELTNENEKLKINNNELKKKEIELEAQLENHKKRDEENSKAIEILNKEITELKKLIGIEKEEKQKMIDDYNKTITTLNEDLKKCMTENQKIDGFKKEIENLNKKEKNKLNTINQQKAEIERLKKQVSFNYKLIKEDNDSLLKQINLLSDNILQIDSGIKVAEEDKGSLNAINKKNLKK